MTTSGGDGALDDALDAVVTGLTASTTLLQIINGEQLRDIAATLDSGAPTLRGAFELHGVSGPDARRLVRALERSAAALRGVARQLDQHRRAAADAEEALERLRERGW